jgi:hypothetical protein
VLKRTRLGLQYSLLVQHDALCLSSAMYDAGHRSEAVRIANAIFVLLGPDMRNHKSILSQLGALDGQLTIPSTADSRGPHGTALIARAGSPEFVAEWPNVQAHKNSFLNLYLAPAEGSVQGQMLAAFLHPTLEIQFIEMLKAILARFNSKALMATHSVVKLHCP